MDINLENEKLNQLRDKYEKIKSSYLSSLERYTHRKDGSARQDALHERFMKEERDEYYAAKQAYEAQAKLVANLLHDKKNGA